MPQTILKVHHYDVSQEDRMRSYVQAIVNNLETVIMTKINELEKVTTSKIDHLSSKLDAFSEGKKK